jgi:phosphoesterase RecJ-like protein
MYLRPIKDLKFQGYIMNNLTITDNGFGYIKLTNDILEQYGVDSSTPGNLINNFGFIDEIIAWGFFTEDIANDNIKGSIRSRGPIINEVLAPYGGGGHKLAAGVRAKTFDMVDEIITKLDEVCKEYNE